VGIIQKQAIKGTIYSYIGVAIGFITTILIYPKIFSTEEVGLLRIIAAYSTLFGQFATLGFNRTTTMLFPFFRDKGKGHNGFLFIAMAVSVAGLILSIILLLALKPLILGNEESQLFIRYFYYIIPLTLFTLFYLAFDNYYKVLYNSVQGTVLKEFVQRVIILVAAILFMFSWIDFYTYILLFLLAFFIPPFVLFLQIIRAGEFYIKPKLSFITKKFRKQLINVSFYGILTSFSGILVLNIDSIMINKIMDLSNTGIYAITFFFGTVILVPSRSLLKISSVVIADAWKSENLKTINEVYYKSCLNQLIIGLLLFLGIWCNVHNYFNEYLLPPEYEAGKYVIFFISLSSVIQMAGGTSNMILFTSPKYRTHTWLMLFLVILLIGSNLVFIPRFGITGAALASAISFLMFNLVKWYYLYKTFGFSPYDLKTIWVLLIAGITFGINTLIPVIDSFIFDILLRSVVIAIVFSGLIFGFGISEDINSRLKKLISK